MTANTFPVIMDSLGSGRDEAEGSCDHANETCESIKAEEYLYHPHPKKVDTPPILLSVGLTYKTTRITH